MVCLAPASASALPDGRGWELVSPVDKNGGAIAAAGEIASGGVLQAAADGNSVTYGSSASFGAGAQGAPEGSQYRSARGAGGWATENLTVPIFSGSYGTGPDGVPYQLFSPDLTRGLLLSGRHCRSIGTECPVANPPLAGTDVPAGYQNYYLRQGGGFEALLGAGDVTGTALDPAEFDLRFAGASPDLAHVVLETCAKLTPNATEVPLGAGCDPAATNLYRWSGGALQLVSLLPAQSQGVPGAKLAAQGAAVSSDGSRVYFTAESAPGERNLYLRDGAQTKQVDAAAAGGGAFETASGNGAFAFFSKGGTLYRYDAQAGTAAPLGSGVLGVLGASEDGSHVYYLTATGAYLWNQGVTITVATTEPAKAIDLANTPPTSGSARVSTDGAFLTFVSTNALTTTIPAGKYNNLDQATGLPDSQVYLYEANTKHLRCVSCGPNGTRPTGPSSIPGANPNGEGEEATRSYKPRALSSDGRRVFFDSRDALVAGDTNKDRDVYQWQAQGTGSCTKAAGCIELISSGRAEAGAVFVDASLSGADVFVLTDESLVASDPASSGTPGSVDLYDARIGGGFPVPDPPIICNGDSCQSLPSEPTDPGLGTLAAGLGNPKVHYFKYAKPRPRPQCRRGSVARGGKCHKVKRTKPSKKGRRG